MESFPSATVRRQTVLQRHLGVVVEESGKILLFRRSDGAGLLAGLWEIPWIPWAREDEALAGLALRYGGQWQVQSSYGWIRHSITHRDIRMEVVRGRLSTREEIAEGAEAGWFRLEEMKDVALSSLVQKILKLSVVDV